MNKSGAALYIVFVVLILSLTSCEILRSEEGAQDEISEFSPPEAAQTEAIVVLQPTSQQLTVGQTLAMDLLIENVVDLMGVDVQIQFTPGALRVQDADPDSEGVQIDSGDFLSSDFVIANEVDNETGTISFIVSQVTSAPVSGSGRLAGFTIEAIEPGDSSLIVASVKLSGPEGQSLPAAVADSRISVVQTEGPTPTIAPDQPTATPTTEPDEELTVTPTFTPTLTPVITVTPLSPTVTLPPPTMTMTATPTPSPLPPPPTATSTPSPLADLPEGATVGFCYRVQKDETLAGLAETFGVSASHIQVVNDLYPRGHIYVQKALFIPTEMGMGPNFYIIQEGDTLAGLAESCNLPADFLAWVNKVDRAATLGAGQALEIPLPPFPPPARYPYPPSGPFGPPSVYPPPSFGAPGASGSSGPSCAPQCAPQG